MFRYLVSITMLLFFFGCEQQLKVAITETHENGAKKKEVYYASQAANPRRVIIYSPQGQVMSDQFMLNGRPDSTTTIFYASGKKYKEVHYTQNKKTRMEMKHGTEMLWYENGQVKSKTDYADGEVQGSAVTYYEDGTKASETPYKNGQKNGNDITYYPDGKLKESVSYTMGDIEGVRKSWYPDGTLKKEETYSKNALNGTWTTYFENGKKETECIYKNGKLDGLKQEWYENGRLAAKATYENNRLIEGMRY